MLSSETEVNTPEKQPIFNLPWVITILIAGMALIHFARTSIMSEAQNYDVIISFAFIPIRYGNTQLLELAPYAVYWSPLTYSLLHADWAHVLMNSFWLLAFGGVTARRLETTRFLILFAVGAICGACLHYLVYSSDI